MRGRSLRVTHASFARTPLSKYTEPAIASDCLFPAPVKFQGYHFCNRTEPSKCDVQVAIKVNSKENLHEIRDRPARSTDVRRWRVGSIGNLCCAFDTNNFDIELVSYLLNLVNFRKHAVNKYNGYGS